MTQLTQLTPPEAIALTHCKLARWRDPGGRSTTHHPTRCGWCYLPDELVAETLDRFDWSGIEVRWFEALTADEQRQHVDTAQALEADGWTPDPVSDGENEPPVEKADFVENAPGIGPPTSTVHNPAVRATPLDPAPRSGAGITSSWADEPEEVAPWL